MACDAFLPDTGALPPQRLMTPLIDSTAQSFLAYQTSEAGQIRYRLAQRNMETLHQLDVPKVILDVGGGNGFITEFLLRRGHAVTLFDSDAEMLKQARQRLVDANLLAQCRLVEGNLDYLSRLFAADHFDLIVAHHILEYLSDVPAVMKSLYTLAKKGGEFSLITLNPVSEVIRAIIFRQEPVAAQSKLTDLSFDSKWFGQATLYPMDQILIWATGAGWSLNDFCGIRILADYLPATSLTETKTTDLIALEERVASLEPYRRFGRYLQFAFQKPQW